MSDNLGSSFNPTAQAIHSRSEELSAKKAWAGKPKTCWQCQKDKLPVGGHVKALPGFYKFVCKDCCEANAKKRPKD